MSDEHSKIEFDIEADTLEMVHSMLRKKLKAICGSASMSIFDEYEESDVDALCNAVGKTMFNEVIVLAIQAMMDEDCRRIDIVDEDEDSIYKKGER
jgi:hypothetical protein